MNKLTHKYTVYVQDIGVIEHSEKVRYNIPTLGDRIRDRTLNPGNHIKIGNYVVNFKFIIGYKVEIVENELDDIPIGYDHKIKVGKILEDYKNPIIKGLNIFI